MPCIPVKAMKWHAERAAIQCSISPMTSGIWTASTVTPSTRNRDSRTPRLIDVMLAMCGHRAFVFI